MTFLPDPGAVVDYAIRVLGVPLASWQQEELAGVISSYGRALDVAIEQERTQQQPRTGPNPVMAPPAQHALNQGPSETPILDELNRNPE